ncbi:MAG: PAC2 family protein [Acidimicrobiia bacterium]
MDFIEWRSEPELENPVAIVAFEGWGDASTSASAAAEFLIEHAEAPFAALDPEDFFNFQMQRPMVQVDGGGSRQVHWPGAEFHVVTVAGRDLIVLVGEEPHLRWRTYCQGIIEVLQSCGVGLVITLGAFIGRVAHTLPVPIFGVATDPDMIHRYQLFASDYQGPTGIIGSLHDQLRRAGLETISLWAAVPHYLAANHNPKVALSLLAKMGEILEIEFDLDELGSEVSDFERRVDDAMYQSEELVTYIRELESDSTEPDMNPEGVSQLISEIEQFLKES